MCRPRHGGSRACCWRRLLPMSHRLSPVCANGSSRLAAVEAPRGRPSLAVAACACSCWAKAMAGPNARMLTAAARATALCRGVRTGLDRPGDRLQPDRLSPVTRKMSRVTRATFPLVIELNFVRAAGNALVASCRRLRSWKDRGPSSCSRRRWRSGVRLVGADLKVDGVLCRVPALASAAMVQVVHGRRSSCW